MKTIVKYWLALILLISLAVSVRAVELKGVENTAKGIGYTQTLADKPLTVVIGGYLNVAISMLGVVFMVLIYIGAFDILGAGGDEAKVKKGRDRIKNGAIGIMLILAAYFITKLIMFIVGMTGYFETTAENPHSEVIAGIINRLL